MRVSAYWRNCMEAITGDRLSWLLDPVTPASFFAEYLGKRVLVVESTNGSKFHQVLSLAEYYGNGAGLRSSDTTFQHRPSLANKVFLAGDDGYIKMDGVLSGYGQGSTV